MKWKLGIAIALIVGLPLGALKMLPLNEIEAILDWVKLIAQDLVISVLKLLGLYWGANGSISGLQKFRVKNAAS